MRLLLAALLVCCTIACAGLPQDDDSTPTPTPEPTPTPPCPQGTTWIDAEAPYCIDTWEAHLVDHSPHEVPESGVASSLPGVQPQAYISGAVAALACDAAGKRLCSLEEWMRACQGPQGTTYPYGDEYDPDACNTSRAEHPIVSYWGNDPSAWDFVHMNDPGINQQPDTVDPTGANAGCSSVEGVFDLHGNLHEWIDDPQGTFKGGFYADASINGAGCLYRTTAHSFDYHDYSTGFRCCTDPR